MLTVPGRDRDTRGHHSGCSRRRADRRVCPSPCATAWDLARSPPPFPYPTLMEGNSTWLAPGAVPASPACSLALLARYHRWRRGA